MGPLITFTTDMAGGFHYLAALKGALYSANIETRIVDITNEIEPFNIRHAAFVLQKAARYFPPKTIHLLHVNAAQANGRMLVAKAFEQYFILFDNGGPTLLFGHELVEYYEVNMLPEEGCLYVQNIVKTVQELSKNELSATPTKEVQRLHALNPIGRTGHITGHITAIDQFQNGISNITKELFERCITDTYTVDINGYAKDKIRKHYNEVQMGELVFFFNKENLLEVAINSGKAAQLMGFKIDSSILIYE